MSTTIFQKTSLVRSFWKEVNISVENPGELVECGAGCAKEDLCNAVHWEREKQRVGCMEIGETLKFKGKRAD